MNLHKSHKRIELGKLKLNILLEVTKGINNNAILFNSPYYKIINEETAETTNPLYKAFITFLKLFSK